MERSTFTKALRHALNRNKKRADFLRADGGGGNTQEEDDDSYQDPEDMGNNDPPTLPPAAPMPSANASTRRSSEPHGEGKCTWGLTAVAL